MYKIKFLTFDSVCLIAVYPPLVILEHNYEICGGKSADIRCFCSLFILRQYFSKIIMKFGGGGNIQLCCPAPVPKDRSYEAFYIFRSVR